MKTSMKEIGWYIFISLFAFTLEGCNGKTMKQEEKKMQSDTLTTNTDSVSVSRKKDIVTQNIPEPQTIVQKTSKQSAVSKEENISQKNIDLDKIYEESEGVRGFPSLNNSQFMDFISKHFKYPDIDPVNGRGKVDLVIERDGTVSDVIIVEGIHPAIDKEFIRVLKLLPKFTPGKINGTPVRSKYRSAIAAQYI